MFKLCLIGTCTYLKDPVPTLTPDLKAKLEAMSVDEISDYLHEELDVPLQYCEAFEGIFM